MGMSFASNPTIRFLRAVHRRHVLLRAVEHGGIGLMIGGFLGLAVLLTAMATGGRPISMSLMTTAALGGALLGIATGWMRRPTMLDSAMQADRQLDMTDLLSTAWSLRQTDDPWARQVLVCANARCRSMSPAAVLLGRWGKRGWGSVALVSLLLICASLLIEQSQNTRAANNSATLSSASSTLSPNDLPTPIWSNPAWPVYRPWHSPDETPESPPNQSPNSEADSQNSQKIDTHTPSTASETNSHDTGPGLARTPSKQNVPLPAIEQSANQSPPSKSNGQATGGGLAIHSPLSAGPSITDGHVTDQHPTTQTQTSPWAASNDTAPSIPNTFDVQANPQYQPYSDMIRQYFQRD
jgi:hypothetical protein